MRRLVFAGAIVALVAAGCGSEGVVGPTAQTVVGSLPQAAPVAKGDPAAGKQLYAANGCAGCHTFKPAGSTGKVGPDLDKLAADAAKANRGTLAQYTAESIKNPGAYVVPGFPNGVMPVFSSLSDKQVADLVAFLTKKS
jgi:mono/diheme cytochrome c family protein